MIESTITAYFIILQTMDNLDMQLQFRKC